MPAKCPNRLMRIKTLALKDEVGDVEKFVAGTTCKIASENNENEWLVEISDIFQVGPVNGEYFIFVNGKYFIPTLQNGNVILHSWTQTPQLIGRDYVRNSTNHYPK